MININKYRDWLKKKIKELRVKLKIDTGRERKFVICNDDISFDTEKNGLKKDQEYFVFAESRWFYHICVDAWKGRTCGEIRRFNKKRFTVSEVIDCDTLKDHGGIYYTIKIGSYLDDRENEEKGGYYVD